MEEEHGPGAGAGVGAGLGDGYGGGGPGSGVGGGLGAGCGGGVLGGGPEEMSPLRELLRLHQVVQLAAKDAAIDQHAKCAYHSYSFDATVLIIKALTEKEGDMLDLKNYHAKHRLDLAREELRLKSLIDALPPHQAAPHVMEKDRANRSRRFHEKKMKFALRELVKISFHLENAFSTLQALVMDPLDNLDSAGHLVEEIEAVVEVLSDDPDLQEEEIHDEEQVPEEISPTLEALIKGAELHGVEIHDDEGQVAELNHEDFTVDVEMLELDVDVDEEMSEADVEESFSAKDHQDQLDNAGEDAF